LLAVEEGAHLEDALDEVAPEPGPDRDQAWFLAYGVLRRRGHVDAALRVHLNRPLADLEPAVRAALRLGAFERLYARAPVHAVVNEAVELVKALGVGRAHGMVNAVVRRVGPVERLGRADALDHPAWIVQRWTGRYGADATARWCEANAEPPPLFVVRREGVAGPDGAPVEVRGRPLAGVLRLDVAAPIPSLPGWAEGGFWVQDAASVAVADLVPVSPGGRVLDACAAPGGKSFRLASRGADVLAVDRSIPRLALVREGAERLHLPITTRVHDWLAGPIGDTFDAVLVDAPCTGLGTLRRHPEIRWRRQEPDLVRAGVEQERILANASEAVAPGGSLVYTVCSPEPEEGEQVVTRFLATHPPFTLRETLATAPPEAGEDAHYGARLERTG
jgi:16S rRNA (cytosine967-C5)-methyltransferase